MSMRSPPLDERCKEFSVRTEISELLILNIQKQIRIGT